MERPGERGFPGPQAHALHHTHPGHAGREGAVVALHRRNVAVGQEGDGGRATREGQVQAICYLLSTALDFFEEEGMMQQSRVSISLNF